MIDQSSNLVHEMFAVYVHLIYEIAYSDVTSKHVFPHTAFSG